MSGIGALGGVGQQPSMTPMEKVISVPSSQGWVIASLRRGEPEMLELGLSFGLKTFEIFVKRTEDPDGKSTIDPHFRVHK